jgi:hypothetical protein
MGIIPPATPQSEEKRKEIAPMSITAKAMLAYLLVALVVLAWMFRYDISAAGGTGTPSHYRMSHALPGERGKGAERFQ